MTVSKIYIIVLITALLLACSTKPKEEIKKSVTARVCDCSKLLTRQERGFYLQYYDGEDTCYTGKCKYVRDNGNEITYMYVKGHLTEEIETYPGGILNEELYYDTTGRFIKRSHYYPNGHKSYEAIFGDHTYETFYNNGSIQRKGGYGFTKEDIGNRYWNLNKVRLYDSIWKEDGSFDSVYHYSKGEITF